MGLGEISAQVDRHVGSAMKSVGEVMAIGRTFEESLQKAVRMVDPRYRGFGVVGPFLKEMGKGAKEMDAEELDRQLANPTDMRLFAIAYAMFEKRYTVEMLHELTKIDKVRYHIVFNFGHGLTILLSGSCTRSKISSTRTMSSTRLVPFRIFLKSLPSRRSAWDSRISRSQSFCLHQPQRQRYVLTASRSGLHRS